MVTNVQDSWELDSDPTYASPMPCTGRALIYDIGSCPQVCEHDVTDEGRLPRQAPSPKDRTPEEKGELHNLIRRPS